MTESTEDDTRHRKQRLLWRLVDKKEALIEQWTRGLFYATPVLWDLKLTARQRRVIAALYWEREASRLQHELEGHSVRPRQPPPIAGLDFNGRIVVQTIKNDGKQAMWALTRAGEPIDIKVPVRSLLTGNVVDIPPHIHTIESN